MILFRLRYLGNSHISTKILRKNPKRWSEVKLTADHDYIFDPDTDVLSEATLAYYRSLKRLRILLVDDSCADVEEMTISQIQEPINEEIPAQSVDINEEEAPLYEEDTINDFVEETPVADEESVSEEIPEETAQANEISDEELSEFIDASCEDINALKKFAEDLNVEISPRVKSAEKIIAKIISEKRDEVVSMMK